MLKHVRPGGGFVPVFPLLRQTSVNGDGAHPVFAWLRGAATNVLPITGGRTWLTNTAPKELAITPARPGDIQWNFEVCSGGPLSERDVGMDLTSRVAAEVPRVTGWRARHAIPSGNVTSRAAGRH